MAGRFNGLTDVQWGILEPLLPKEPEKKKQRIPTCSMEASL